MGAIGRRLAMIEKHVERLKGVGRSLNYESFLVNDETQTVVERRLHICLEALIDVGLRIVSHLGLEKPERYRDLPVILVRSNVIPNNELEVFEKMISFRNVLVHLYAELDPARVYEALQKTDDIRRMASHIANFVRDKGVDP